jgi:hypothetical protein
VRRPWARCLRTSQLSGLEAPTLDAAPGACIAMRRLVRIFSVKVVMHARGTGHRRLHPRFAQRSGCRADVWMCAGAATPLDRIKSMWGGAGQRIPHNFPVAMTQPVKARAGVQPSPPAVVAASCRPLQRIPFGAAALSQSASQHSLPPNMMHEVRRYACCVSAAAVAMRLAAAVGLRVLPALSQSWRRCRHAAPPCAHAHHFLC